VRGFFVAVLLVIGGVLAILSQVSFWTQRAVLDEDGFVERVGSTLDDEDVQEAIATRLANRAEVLAEERLRDRLTELDERIDPETGGRVDEAIDLAILARPVAGALRDIVYDATLTVQQDERVQTIRDGALRLLYRQVTAIINDDPDALLKGQDGKLILDLRPILEAALERAGVSADLEGIIVIADLPEDAGQFEIGEEGDYSFIGRIVDLVDGLHYPLLGATAAVLGLAIVVSENRRRGLIAAALTVVAATAVLLIAIPTGRYVLVNAVLNPQNLEAANAVFNILFIEDLREQGLMVMAVALLVAAGGAFFGESSTARALRSKVGLLKDGEAPTLLQALRDDAAGFRAIGAILTVLTLLVLQQPSGRTVAAVIVLFGIYLVVLLVLTSGAEWAVALRRYANLELEAQPAATTEPRPPEGWIARNSALLRALGVAGALIFLLFWSSTSLPTVMLVAVLTLIYLAAVDMLAGRGTAGEAT